jgi:hypothetical protein
MPSGRDAVLAQLVDLRVNHPPLVRASALRSKIIVLTFPGPHPRLAPPASDTDTDTDTDGKD